ncbi:MAG TPA: hypothetical protein DCG54_02360 [Anaerolineae bacterium]|jgi:LysM repeat protein|nr:hypothetical protein [Anaerolineae bacterium]
MEEKMKSRNTLVGQVLLVILALSLTACERSASTSPQADPLFPEAATPSMELVQELQFGTQTAQAESGIVVAEETPDPFGTLPPLGNETPIAETPTETFALDAPTPDPVIVAQPTVETVRPATYTLQKGEFPYCIARRFNVNPADLLSLNGLTRAQSNSLQPGLVLRIPTSGVFGSERALLAHPTTYIVQSGDSIYSIACKFGDVDPVNIAAVNGLGAPYTLTVGTSLQIP